MTFHTPQIIYLCLILLSLGIDLARHGEQKKSRQHNFWASLVSTTILLGILCWGGFFK